MTKTEYRDDLIAYLEKERDKEDGNAAMFAQLRRGLGQPPGTSPQVSRVVQHFLKGDYDPRENAYYVIAPLFALHKKEGGVGNMGDHFHKLWKDNTTDPNDDKPPPNLERRFISLLASSPEEFADALRQAVALLKSNEVAVDWHKLMSDAQIWLDTSDFAETRRLKVKQIWSRRFWQLKDKQDNSKQTATEDSSVTESVSE